MKKLIFVGVAAAAFATGLVSCQDSQDLSQKLASTVPDKEVSYVIPQAEAVATLIDFMRETRSRSDEEELLVDTVYSVVYPRSRAFNDPIPADTVLYIVNFRNNIGHSRGYAIIAADNRIPDEILAVVEEGNLTSSRFKRAVACVKSSNISPLDRFPDEGPGFFTSEDYPGETFINPKTMSWYDETREDYLIGNFTFTGESEINGSPSPSTSETLDFSDMRPHEAYIMGTLMGYVAECIGPIHDFECNENFEYREIDLGYMGGLNPGNPHNGFTLGRYRDPLLTDFKYWHQFSPFNDLCPYRSEYESANEPRRAPTGCLPLSIAKIMAYYNQPDSAVYGGIVVDWPSLHNSLDTSTYQFPTSTGNQSAAALLARIGNGCECEYFYDGTFAFPSVAAAYLRSEGFLRVSNFDYSFADVKELLEMRTPVVVYTMPKGYALENQCWNIDGYKIYYRTVNGQTDYSVTRNMVHCDFGCKGVSNGWYSSKPFEINYLMPELDEDSEAGGDLNLNPGLKILTFSRTL